MPLELLAGTLVLRPYVFAFLAAFLLIAFRDLGPRRALGFLGLGFCLAFVAEYASTRIGIPFGLYHYTGATAGRELFLSNVPFFDPLSFPFLAYASWCLARQVLGRSHGLPVVGLAAFSMMILDVVIDPLALRGERWFLGHLFYYPEGGVYFGVPLSNFAGWFVVGFAIVGGFLALAPVEPKASPGAGVGLYYGVLAFNLAITAWIGEHALLAAGLALHALLAMILWRGRVPLFATGSLS
jgi:putative membrane protein